MTYPSYCAIAQSTVNDLHKQGKFSKKPLDDRASWSDILNALAIEREEQMDIENTTRKRRRRMINESPYVRNYVKNYTASDRAEEDDGD